MATPPDPRVYMADDFSWAKTSSNPATAWQNFYMWDGHGGISPDVGRGSPKGYGFGGEPSSGILSWTIIDLDTLLPILSATCGVAYGNDMHGITAVKTLLRFKDSPGGAIHVDLATDASNHLVAYGESGALGATDGVTGGAGLPEFILPASAIDGTGPMYHIEVIVTISDTVGTVQIWVEDTLVMNLVNVDTKNSAGTAVVGNVEWHVDGSGGRRIAEIIVHDGSARLGSEWRVGYVPVATDGTYSNGTAVGAATGLQAVDDAPADAELEITTYHVLDSSGTPKKASFQSGAMPASALDIRDIHPQIVIEKSDGGTNTAKLGLRSGSIEVYTTSAFAVPDAWVARRLALRRDITAGDPLWTILTAEASEVIIDRES